MAGPFENTSANHHVEIFDGRTFTFRIEIFNEDGKITQIKKAGIDSLVVEDNILNPFLTATLTLKNPYDMLERSTKQYADTVLDLNTFRFRGDARDFVNIMIAPSFGENMDDATHVQSDMYSLKQTFVVYKIEDVPSTSVTDKKKRLYLHDLKYQKLIEKDLYWSSGAAAIRQKVADLTKPMSQLTNDQRSIQTGVGIKDMIQQAIPDQVFDKNWDLGARSVFWTSPASWKAFDDIMYLAGEHVSSDDTGNQPCILKHERFTKSWSLLPLSKYFEGGYNKSKKVGGPLQVEKFFIANQIDEDGGNKPDGKSPDGGFHHPDMSLIENYVFSEMPGIKQQQTLISTPVVAYQPYTKEFQFYHSDQAIESMFDFFKENVTDALAGGESGPFTDFFINNTKKENRNVNLKYTTHTDKFGALQSSRNQVLKQALFGGAAIMFETIGMPNRRSARFITVDRQNPYEANDYDSKLLGQYFITNVTHTFSNKGYTTSIMGVKPYYYNEVQFNNDIK